MQLVFLCFHWTVFSYGRRRAFFLSFRYFSYQLSSSLSLLPIVWHTKHLCLHTTNSKLVWLVRTTSSFCFNFPQKHHFNLISFQQHTDDDFRRLNNYVHIFCTQLRFFYFILIFKKRNRIKKHSRMHNKTNWRFFTIYKNFYLLE